MRAPRLGTIGLILALAAALTGCSRSSKSKAAKEAAARPPVVAENTASQPAQGAPDYFEPPAAGARRWLRLQNGQTAGGELVRVDASTVVLRNGDEVQTFSREELAPGSRAELFAADFRSAPPPTMITPVPPLPPRYTMTDRNPLRYGPGPAYRTVAGVDLQQGAPLLVERTSGDWLEVKANGQVGWILRWEAFPADERDLADRQAEVDLLTSSGLLKSIDPALNQALIDLNMWRGMESRQRMGVARILATYCAATRQSSASRVDLLDAESRRRLGRFSQSQGWREAAL